MPSSETFEMGSPENGQSLKKKNSRLIIFIGLLCLAIVGLIIGIAILASRESSESPTSPPSSTTPPPDTGHTEELRRIDCYPEATENPDAFSVDEEKCAARGCVYDPGTRTHRAPRCYVQPGTGLGLGYTVAETEQDDDRGMRIRLTSNQEMESKRRRRATRPDAVFEATYYSDNLLRFKLYPDTGERYEVPREYVPMNLPTPSGQQNKYKIEVNSQDEVFSFSIVRTEDNAVLWNTSFGALSLEDQLLTVTTELPTRNVYGFGENSHLSFRHDINFRTWGLFARDQWVTTDDQNHYGVHPFYTCMEQGGKSHGVLLLNSNAMDYTFSPQPSLTYRVIGGVLDFYMFMGPTPENVVQQYAQVIGKPYMPPYWSLGFQLCRYGYNTLENMQTAINRTLDYDYPLDVQYADIDTYDVRKVFTVDDDAFAGLPQYFEHLRSQGMHTIIILDPTFIVNETDYEPHDDAMARDVYIKWPNREIMPDEDFEATNSLSMVGFVWPMGKVGFPDFLLDRTNDLWKELIIDHFETIKFDGLWIDMNEPANFGTNEERPWNWPEEYKPYWSLHCPEGPLDDPPYPTLAVTRYEAHSRLSEKTLCMIAKQKDGQYDHYDVHNLYGTSQIKSTLSALRQIFPGKRSLVVGRSTFVGSGHLSGHWLGDNFATWESMHMSIVGMLEFNLFGFPYIGADICGFFGDTNLNLCKRWTQIGAFYPYARSHNQIDSVEDNDPGFWAHDEDFHTVTLDAFRVRYKLLPYLYTLFHHAHTRGDTVVRPIHHEFPQDETTYGIDTQFMWGDALLISPILHDDSVTHMYYYLPQARWYNYYTHGVEHVAHLPGVNYSMLVAPDTKIPLHLRGGHVIPLQDYANNTHYSRMKPFHLLVMLDEEDSNGGKASGDLYWDDGEALETFDSGEYYYATFESANKSLHLRVEHNNVAGMGELVLNDIRVFGVTEEPASISINGNNHADFIFDSNSQNLLIQNLNLAMNFNEVQIVWGTPENFDYTADELARIDCYPEALENPGSFHVSEASCLARGCHYEADTTPGAPRCYMSASSRMGLGYTIDTIDEDDTGIRIRLSAQQQSDSRLKRETKPNAIFEATFHGENLLRFQLYPDTGERYRVPEEVVPLNLPEPQITTTRHNRYKVEVDDSAGVFSFKITRQSDGTVLWDTSIGAMSLEDQLLTVTTKLPTKNVYGFGENSHLSFRHDMNFRTWGLFARDQWVTTDDQNHYGVHPFYTCMEQGGKSHGVLLLNSNAMDYTFSPLPALTYRVIGGVLDFYMFMGPSPENVVQQYTALIGKPYMPPYWSLGFQLCRYGYNTLENMQQAVSRTLDNGYPLDVQYADIDTYDVRKVFTVDPVNFAGLKEYFNELRDGGMKTIIILDPTFIVNETNYEPHDEAMDRNVYIKWPSREVMPDEDFDATNSLAMVGFVWPMGKCGFPDFFLERTNDLWEELIIQHVKEIPYDGLWIDMNEPANFGTNEERPWNWPEDYTPYWSLKCPEGPLDDPPYPTLAVTRYEAHSRLSEKTLCMIAKQGDGQYDHYDVHNLYGASQIASTLRAMRNITGLRSLVVGRSTFVGSGKLSGHWLGDNFATWESLRMSIVGMLEFNLFGFPYIGADICGFFGDTNLNLCKRWTQIGAFYPYARSHNQIDSVAENDPGYWAHDPDFKEVTLDAFRVRYMFLPYLYTLFYHAHIRGDTVVRPLHHQFPEDEQTYGIDTQFMWGPALLISPILHDDTVTTMDYYLPRGRWFNYYTDTAEAYASNPGMEHSRPVESNSKIPLHMHGGHTIMTQDYANNTHFSRQKPFHLLVMLDDEDQFGGKSSGDFFWDDGQSIDTIESGDYYFAQFESSDKQLTIRVEHNNLPDMSERVLADIAVYGVSSLPAAIFINGTEHGQFTHDQNTQKLLIGDLDFKMDFTEDIVFDWGRSSAEVPSQAQKERIDCLPDSWRNVSTTCADRGCIHDTGPLPPGVPGCYVDVENFGYRIQADTIGKDELLLDRVETNSMFGGDFDTISLTVQELSNHVLNIKIVPHGVERYEVPIKLNHPSGEITETEYEFDYVRNESEIFSFTIKRKSTGVAIWDTSVGGLAVADQFLQIVSRLPSFDVYGIGEHEHHSFRHDFNYKTWPLFARDQPPSHMGNLYGAHPYYTCIEDDEGHSHGVFLFNSNAMEIGFQPSPQINYRVVGGILDFYYILGDNPEQVTQRYTELIGRPYFPPYWALGFQLSRYGYNNLTNMKDAVERTINAGIPFDVQYGDIDHFDGNRDFTYDKINFAGLPEYFQELRDKGMKTVIILDPALIGTDDMYEPFTDGRDKDVFIKWPEGQNPQSDRFDNDYMHGYVWPEGEAVFPDYFLNETMDWWRDWIVDWYHNGVSFDGLWIDMNEPANFDTNQEKPWNWPPHREPWNLICPESQWDDPPYKPNTIWGPRLSDKTLCMVGTQLHGKLKQYDTHNLYGWSQSEPTLRALRESIPDKRGMVISRSTFPTSGTTIGHWLGDNASIWPHLYYSIIGMLEFNLFGIPYIGADICGYFNDVTDEMCERWMQLGAFYTYSRNHNGFAYRNQDPAYFGSEIALSSRQALETRYRMLPYLYTLHFRAHVDGATIIRPLHHEFVKDNEARRIDRQFLWGPAVLISPVLDEGSTTVNAYFPASSNDDCWYDFYTGSPEMRTGRYHQLDAPYDYIPVHLRGGFIIPTQPPANTTHFSRQKPFGLIVAPDASGVAKGEMFWDDGETIDTVSKSEYALYDFTLNQNELEMTISHSYTFGKTLDDIRWFGVSSRPGSLTIDGTGEHTDYTYNSISKELYIYGLNLPMDSIFKLTLNFN